MGRDKIFRASNRTVFDGFDDSKCGKVITIESKISVSCTNEVLFIRIIPFMKVQRGYVCLPDDGVFHR